MTRWAVPAAMLVAGVGAGLAIGLFARGATPAAQAAKPAAHATRRHGQKHLLFVLDGSSASATRAAGGTWRLRLRNAGNVLWFYDRPARDSGNMTAKLLAHGWGKAFHGSVPNAAIVAPGGPKVDHPTALTVRSMTVDARQNVVLTVAPERAHLARDERWLGRLTSGSEARNGRVVVFLDDSTADGYTENFRWESDTIFPNQPLSFVNDPNSSTCGHPNDVTQSATTTDSAGRTVYIYYGTFDVADMSFRCNFEDSQSWWYAYDTTGKEFAHMWVDEGSDFSEGCTVAYCTIDQDNSHLLDIGGGLPQDP